MDKEKLKQKLINLKVAFAELNELWTNEFDGDYLSFNYPFGESFDELTLKVFDWVDINTKGRI